MQVFSEMSESELSPTPTANGMLSPGMSPVSDHGLLAVSCKCGAQAGALILEPPEAILNGKP